MGGRKTGGGWRSGETGVECRCLGVAWSSGVVLYGPMQSRGVAPRPLRGEQTKRPAIFAC
jgi:hypothetical protein